MIKKIITILATIPTFCFAQWSQIGGDIHGEAAGDASGYSTALSSDGSIVAIGAPSNQGFAGHVRIFANVNGIWSQIGGDIDGDPGGQAGQYVSLSADGSIVAIGEPILFNSINGSVAGRVRVFSNVNNVWTQIGNDIVGESFNWQTGAVSLSSDGSILAVGSRGADVSGIGTFTGKVRVYQNQAGSWVQIGNDLNGFGVSDFFGVSVALSSDGNVVAVGAIGDPINGDIGYVSVFENIAGVWTQIGMNINGTTQAGEFGFSVSLSADGTIVAIGEPIDSSGKGLAQVFKNVNGLWTQIGNTLLGQAVDDKFGCSVALSDNGTMLAVGARHNDGNGLNAGSTKIFKEQAGNWVQVDNIIIGESSGDQAGFSVSLSANGSIVATAAIHNDGNGSNSGQVRIYENSIFLGSEEFHMANNLSVFPNPIIDIFQVRSDYAITGYELFNLSGQLIDFSEINNLLTFEINMFNLKEANYILRVNTLEGITNLKLVKL
jgi:hypothetical protein